MSGVCVPLKFCGVFPGRESLTQLLHPFFRSGTCVVGNRHATNVRQGFRISLGISPKQCATQ